MWNGSTANGEEDMISREIPSNGWLNLRVTHNNIRTSLGNELICSDSHSGCGQLCGQFPCQLRLHNEGIHDSGGIPNTFSYKVKEPNLLCHGCRSVTSG